MNYDKIILEMLGRIQTLEEQFEDLSARLENPAALPADEGENGPSEPLESGRKRSLLEILKILREQYQLDARKANRSEGGGVVITKGESSYSVKLAYSRSYFEYFDESLLCSGWHTLLKSEMEASDFSHFIFVVAGANEQFYYFIFTRADLNREFRDKVSDASKRIHFYFKVTQGGKPLESRDVEKDMGAYYNNWDVFLH